MKDVSEITKPYSVSGCYINPYYDRCMGMWSLPRYIGGKMPLVAWTFLTVIKDFDELILRQRTMLPEEQLSSVLAEMSGGCKCGRNKA